MDNLIQHCLGSDFEKLSPLIAQTHTGAVQLQGYATVQRGNRWAQWLANCMRLPADHPHCPLTVKRLHGSQKMVLQRRFGKHKLDSYFQKKGQLLLESMGPITLAFRLSVEQGDLVYHLHSAKFLFIPLPKCLMPTVSAREHEHQAKSVSAYHFRVKVTLPFIGQLIQYQGELKPH